MDRTGARFVGSAGQTQVLGTTVWCGGCGVRFGGEFYIGLNGETSSALVDAFLGDGYPAVNSMACPSCGWAHVAVEPLTVHFPRMGRLVLVVPEALRHRAEQARAALIAAVAEGPGALLPDYAREPELVVGPDGLAALVVGASVEAQFADDDDETTPPPLPEPPEVEVDFDLVPDIALEAEQVAALEAEAAASVEVAAELSASEGVAGAATDVPASDPIDADEHDEPTGRADADELSVVEALLSVDVVAEESLDLDAGPPPMLPEDETVLEAEGGSREVVPPVPEGNLLAAVLGAPRSAGEGVVEAAPAGSVDAEWADIDQAWSLDAVEPPRTPDDEPTHVVRVEDISPRHPAGPTFDEAAAAGGETYFEIDGDALRAVARVSAERAAWFESEPTVLRFQLHQPAAGPIATVLIVREDASGNASDALAWIIDPGDELHQRALAMLGQVFAVDVVFHDEDGAFHGRRMLRAPLEGNVATARAVLAEADTDVAAARAQVLAKDYDLVGRLRHNFARDSFATLTNAAEARLGLGILSYWSAPERREYLLRIRSFPSVWFEAITRRVLQAAVHFGLAMDPHLRQRALELGLAPNAAELAQTCLSHFAEVNLNLRPSELDALDLWENWEALLTLAEELDLRVSEDIEDVAAQAMERARMAAREAELIDLDQDASVEVEEITDLLEPDDHDLVRLLTDPNRRLEAAMALIQGGSAVNVGPLFGAMVRMSREELLWAVPAALSMGPAFENSFVQGLRSERTSLRLACALALGEIRSERAGIPLLRLIQRARSEEWPVLARAAARIGRRILGPALRVVKVSGDDGHRVAHTLALLGTEARGALAAAKAQHSVPAVIACLERALAELGRVGFGDPADFTERLSDAFRDAGPDQVGPDFQEDLVSVDLGPGASISVETDVDLDDLDGSGHG